MPLLHDSPSTANGKGKCGERSNELKLKNVKLLIFFKFWNYWKVLRENPAMIQFQLFENRRDSSVTELTENALYVPFPGPVIEVQQVIGRGFTAFDFRP